MEQQQQQHINMGGKTSSSAMHTECGSQYLDLTYLFSMEATIGLSRLQMSTSLNGGYVVILVTKLTYDKIIQLKKGVLKLSRPTTHPRQQSN